MNYDAAAIFPENGPFVPGFHAPGFHASTAAMSTVDPFLKPSCWNRLVLPFGLALLGLCLNLIVAVITAPTTDEDGHISYGAAILRGSADRSYWWYDSKTPISVFNAIPRVVISKVLESYRVNPKLTHMLRSVRVARCATLIAAFCFCLLVYFYAESLFGRVAGLFTQLLFVLSPNIIAHSTLATSDLYAALAFVLFLYCLRRFLLVPSPANSGLAGAALALAQLVKFVGVYLYATLVLVLVSVVLYRKFGRQDVSRVPGSRILLLLAFHAIFFLAFINAGFLFDRTLTPLRQYEFRSTMFHKIQHIPLVREVPLPVPYPYIQGFDWMSYHNETGLSFGNIVLLDEVRGRELERSDGFASYYLVCYALKEPLGIQILLLLGIIWLVRHRSFGDFLSGEFPLMVTAVALITILSIFNNAQIGIRHILPALVAFVILSGAAFTAWTQSSRRRKVLLGGCLLYVAISSVATSLI